MKIKETATFIFCFKGIKTKDKSLEILKKFLIDNDWLDAYGMKKAPLYSYHTGSTGIFEIILQNDQSSEEFNNHVEELVEGIKAINDIKWIKTLYNDNTFNIVHKEAGKYQKQQTDNLAEMETGNEVYVYFA